MSTAPETKVVIAGGGLSVRYGDRRAFCHDGMKEERFAAASADCDALLREMVADLVRAEARGVALSESPLDRDHRSHDPSELKPASRNQAANRMNQSLNLMDTRP